MAMYRAGGAISFEEEKGKWADSPHRLGRPVLPFSPFPGQSLLCHPVQGLSSPVALQGCPSSVKELSSLKEVGQWLDMKIQSFFSVYPVKLEAFTYPNPKLLTLSTWILCPTSVQPIMR